MNTTQYKAIGELELHTVARKLIVNVELKSHSEFIDFMLVHQWPGSYWLKSLFELPVAEMREYGCFILKDSLLNLDEFLIQKQQECQINNCERIREFQAQHSARTECIKHLIDSGKDPEKNELVKELKERLIVIEQEIAKWGYLNAQTRALEFLLKMGPSRAP